MRKTDGIIDIYRDKIVINIERFYDNLKLSLKYNGQDDEFGIYANGITHFKNAIIETFEYLNKGVCVELNNRLFSDIEYFLTWLYLENNIELGIERHKDFIDKVYDTIKEKGYY